jgi:MYXO-CTERM domain-containing protein
VSAHGAAYVGSAYEGFGYTAGNMTNTLNGGTGWNATGDSLLANTTTWGVTLAPNGNTVASGVYNLGGTTANQQITAGGAALIAGAGQAGRNFGQNVDSGTFYFSYTAKKTDVDVRTVNFAFFGDAGAAANPTERFSIGQIANNTNLRLADGTTDPSAVTKANQGNFAVLVGTAGAQASGSFTSANSGVYTAATEQAFTLGDTFQIVGKVEFNYAGGNGFDDRITVYINPGSLTDENLVSPYITLDKFNIGTLTGFRVFAGGNQTNQTVGAQTGLTFAPSAAEFDEIRLGTTYTGVTGAIPEPSSFTALAGLAGLAFAATRRRRD